MSGLVVHSDAYSIVPVSANYLRQIDQLLRYPFGEFFFEINFFKLTLCL
jgi:hypothetical protein